jgi:dihydrofolate reductase
MISMIVAVAENLAIGKNNDLLWHIPADLKRFKAITTGHTVVMGRKTYLSLPRRPLPDRRNIVISDIIGENLPGCDLVYSIEEALEHCAPDDECFIIGGASVYRQCLPFTRRLYLTKVHKEFEGDVFFPQINEEEWRVISTETIPETEELGFGYTNLVLERI